MVSIPDFSRWGRLVPSEKSMSIQEKYEKHREEEVIKCAKETGYFVNLTHQFIVENFTDNDEEAGSTADIRSIQRIDLGNSHIRNIGALEYCKNLRYLNLSGNYLTNIDALVTCQMLIKLDLSSNQLESLPRSEFWTTLRHLQLLFLHDNPIGQVDGIAGMSGCRQLVILTLYDTPISLKRNYRHHVVNSIWSLKALDHYVISDEEIIEDANFKNDRFKLFSADLRMKLYRCVPKGASLLREKQMVFQLLTEVNHTLSHNSPVLIIQRYIKGYLTRKKLRLQTTTINKLSASKDKPPSEKQSLHEEEEENKTEVQTTYKRETSSTTIIKGPSTREELLPYAATPPIARQLHESDEYGARTPAEYFPPPRGAAKEIAARKQLHIDLQQLNATQMEILEARTHEMEEAMSERVDTLPAPDNTVRTEVKVPYGPLSTPTSASVPHVKTKLRTHSGSTIPLLPYSEYHQPTRIKDFYRTLDLKDYHSSHDKEDQLPETPFRLVGRKEGVRHADPVMEMILRRAEAGLMIREAESEYHRAKLLQPPPRVRKFPHQTNDQRLFGRVQCTMGTLLLQKWDRMDRDILLQDLASRYTENTIANRNAKAQAKRNIGIWRDDQRGRMKNERRLEKRDIDRSIQYHKDKESEGHRIGKAKRDKMQNLKENLRKDKEFAKNFRGQHNSVSKALMKHDRYALNDEKLQARSSFVKCIREDEKEKLDTIRKYLDLQAKERHKEMAQMRQEIDTKVLQETNQRLLEAHTRVEHLRSLKRFFQELPALTNCNYPAAVEVDPSQPTNLKDMNRFEVEAAYHTGRVGKHPIVG